MKRRDYLDEVSKAMTDLSLSDDEAVKKALAIANKSRASDMNKAFALDWALMLRQAKQRKQAQVSA